ncbi:hypothetical protein [Nocardia sp. NPDC020380]|uniref:hypothetical protein n=1 Tax=Nocardia sp. NPDC020380 TaxID=3364309 RepID=UPI0037B519BD
MTVRRGALVAAVCGVVLSVPVVAQADSPELGGCARGGLLTAQMVPGTGSAGQGIHRETDLWDCASPLLPGIVSGHFTAEEPWITIDNASARITWSDGSVSTAIGYPNELWTITDGPASGHTLRLALETDMTAQWYHLDTTMPVRSASFME